MYLVKGSLVGSRVVRIFLPYRLDFCQHTTATHNMFLIFGYMEGGKTNLVHFGMSVVFLREDHAWTCTNRRMC